MSQYSFELGESHRLFNFDFLDDESPELGAVLHDFKRGRLYRVESIEPRRITEIDLFPGMKRVIGRRFEVFEVNHS